MDNSIDINVRWIMFGMSVLPVASCLFCIFYTFVSNSSLVYAASMADCAISSSFPTVSVSIGPWEPQRLIWITTMFIHIPMRLLITMLYPTIWPQGKLRNFLSISLIAETFATLLVSIFHVQSIAGETIHAICFTFWAFATGGMMLITITLHRIHGREKGNKSIIFGLYLLFSLICASSHPISTKFCIQWVYALFCLSEYALMLTTAAFWISILSSLSEHFDRVSIHLSKTSHEEMLPRVNTPITFLSMVDSLPSRPLRVLLIDNYPDANGSCLPWPTMDRTQRCPYPGWCLEILSNLVAANNISVEYIVEPIGQNVDWGRIQPDNQTFSGLLGRIQRDEADMSCLLYQKSVVRSAHFEFSIPVSEITPSFIVREYPITLSSLLLNCLKPYQDSVWICILVGVIVQMLFWPLIARTEKSLGLRKETDRWGDSVWAVINDWLNGGDQQFFLYSGVLLRLIFSIFQVGLLPAMYTAALLFALLSPSDNSPLKSQNDALRLLSSGSYKLITDKGMWFYQEMVASSEPLFIGLREATRNNPIVEASDANAINLVDQGNYIWQVQDDMSAMPLVLTSCFTIVFSQGLPYRSAHFLFAKGNEWRPVIDQAILKSYSMVDTIRRRYFVDRIWDPSRSDCPRSPYAMPGPTDPLNFWAIFGVFALAAIGLGVSIIFLFCEVIVDLIVNFRERRANWKVRRLTFMDNGEVRNLR
ncbi:hypothetical protein PENTCL1PPCAC_17678 [Pristionchus entomophagus]|uniref:CWH43-like N-terminal domain-containing protein n=1 Tax=Pristionchus entomophagus TaxID=358040 RepID=A0AAV5TM52_9BILA|nr:hypothetical protein PENTCL1PPCAC_17678 [Pristionchus entomophagus]